VLASAQTFLGFQARPYADGEPLSSIVINATLLPRALVERLGFDSQLVYGYDEVDLASRAVRAGCAIVPCPQAVNDHRPSPRGREGYSAVLNASRLYVTFKRYAFTERRLARAAAYALVAPAHVLAAGIRREGLHGGRAGMAALWLAFRYVVRSRRA
jgi:GT2 family glycosyltransferase